MKTKIFSDLDKCLIDDKYNYTMTLASLKDLIAQAKSLGVELSINSNRSLKDILPFYKELGFNGMIIGENGSFSYSPAAKVFTEGSAKEILDVLEKNLSRDVRLEIINTNDFVKDPVQFKFDDGLYVLAEESRAYTGSLYCREIINRAPKLSEALRKNLRATLDFTGLLKKYNALDSSNCVLTVVPKDCDKTKPMQRDSGNWICAIGDGLVDIPVLQFADFSAAPANAKPEVKEIVDYVSPKSVTDGVYDILEGIIRGLKNG